MHADERRKDKRLGHESTRMLTNATDPVIRVHSCRFVAGIISYLRSSAFIPG